VAGERPIGPILESIRLEYARSLRACTGQCSCLSPRFSGRRTTDPVTGQRRKKELNDKLVASIHDPGDHPAPRLGATLAGSPCRYKEIVRWFYLDPKAMRCDRCGARGGDSRRIARHALMVLI
jgi:hypothetical protein